MTAVFIDGAAGTTGLEIEARLAGRDAFDLIRLDDRERKDPTARRAALNAAEVVILCLPDAAARDAVAMVDNRTTRIIDASSAHRVAPGWTYGFPELGHEVSGAMRVSNPGCYPTGFLGLVAPLVRTGLLPADWPLTVNAVSGYSGGGKTLIERFGAAGAPAFRSYGFGASHKHLVEMQHYAGLRHAPVFAPSVAALFRGMIVEVPLALAALPGRPSRAAMVDALSAAYADSPVVRVHSETPDELVLAGMADGHDRLDLYVCTDPGETQLRLVAVLDNLGKGASGAAVQSLNLMTGQPPTAGLRL